MTTSLDLRIEPRECTPWCTDGSGHGEQHPEDRYCTSPFEIVPLTHTFHQPAHYTDGTWGRPYLNVYVRREHDLEESHVVIHSEETDKELYPSLTEANQLREHLEQPHQDRGEPLTPQHERTPVPRHRGAGVLRSVCQRPE